jgi:hypothetical protein
MLLTCKMASTPSLFEIESIATALCITFEG